MDETQLFFPSNDPFIVYLAKSLPPYTTPALTANLVCRVALGILANLLCLVPLRLLYHNHELAAVVFILNIEFKNILTIVSALIWRDDNMEDWWAGYGLCDFASFANNFSFGLFDTCMLAIMRNLAHQANLLSAHPLSAPEKRRRNLVHVLIMFPLPIVQVGWTWFLTAQRYLIGTLTGCTWTQYPSWPYVVFFALPPLVLSVVTVGYAVLTSIRFRRVTRSTESVLSSNRVANYRAQRARRRLYLMVVSVLVPYFPVVVTIFIMNIRSMGQLSPYRYEDVHHSTWDYIILIPSTKVPFLLLNHGWIPILSAIPVIVFFGMTKEAINDYRRVLLLFALGRFFPRLHCEYDPDVPGFADGSFGSSHSAANSGSSKYKTFTSSQKLRSMSTSSGETAADPGAQLQSLDFLTSPDIRIGHDDAVPLQRPQQVAQPPSSYEATMHRNPFLFRTNLNLPTITFKIPHFITSSKNRRADHNCRTDTRTETVPLATMAPAKSRWTADSGPVLTQVWSDEEAAAARRQCRNTTSSSTHGHDHDTHPISSDRRTVHVETFLVCKSSDPYQR